MELPSPLQLFMMYDQDETRSVDLPEFGQMLYDLDGLEVGCCVRCSLCVCVRVCVRVCVCVCPHAAIYL